MRIATSSSSFRLDTQFMAIAHATATAHATVTAQFTAIAHAMAIARLMHRGMVHQGFSRSPPHGTAHVENRRSTFPMNWASQSWTSCVWTTLMARGQRR